MSDWRSTVTDQAEQVVEYHGVDAGEQRGVDAVETLTSDPVFQETALAFHRADLAQEAAHRADHVEEDLASDLFAASDDLLAALRERGADLLDLDGGEQA